MFVAASTHCFAEKNFTDACGLIADLEYDKIELWFDEESDQLRPSEVVPDPEGFVAKYRETTRLTPVAICLEHDTDLDTFSAVIKVSKLLRVTQITVPASPLGTPFNAEIDRLKAFLSVASQEGIRLSIKTKTGQLTEDIHTAAELCQSVSGLGLTLDPSYYVCGPNRDRNIEIVFPYVYHLHLRDTTPDCLQVQAGLGEIDYTRLISQLRRQNYARALSVDLIPSLMEESERPLEMRKLRMLLETLL